MRSRGRASRQLRVLLGAAALALGLLASCSSTASPAPTTTASTSSTTTTTSTTPPSTTTSTSTSTTSTTLPPTTATSTTEVPPTNPPSTTAPASTVAPTTASTVAPPSSRETRVVGTSVDGRPITALHRGTPGGHVVLVIGVIHGDETAGSAITSRLATMALPKDVDLWLVESMNPDGQAAGDRHNADQVDLNRNFPYNWGPIGNPGDPEYAGSGPASEPETRAMVAFIGEIDPEMVIWYHQDLDRIAPSSGRDGRIRARYAALTGVPLLAITGGRYTGVAATWARHELGGGVAFIVELGPTLDDATADAHAAAVLTVAAELG